MMELYAASDLYVSLSQWEGYNLGISQALAMGLPVISSDIPAHREFGGTTSNHFPVLCNLVKEARLANTQTQATRASITKPWIFPLTDLKYIIEEDLNN